MKNWYYNLLSSVLSNSELEELSFEQITGALIINIRWQTYRALELIADSVPQPQTDKLAFVAVWRSLFCWFTQQLDCEHQIEHLERCLALDWTKFRDTSKPSIWLTLEAFLSQLMLDSSLATSEPEIQQVSDQGGRTWWYACEPRTGQTTYLESEADVQIWLEERHYLSYDRSKMRIGQIWIRRGC